MPSEIILQIKPFESMLLKQKLSFPPEIMNCYVCSSLIEPNGRHMPPQVKFFPLYKVKITTSLFFYIEI